MVKDSYLLCSLLYLQCLEQCLAHSRYGTGQIHKGLFLQLCFELWLKSAVLGKKKKKKIRAEVQKGEPQHD